MTVCRHNAQPAARNLHIEPIEIVTNILLGHRERRTVNQLLDKRLLQRQRHRPSPASTAGKSAAGNVDKVNRLRPAFTVALPVNENSILEPSGKDLQMSTSFLAGTVISPSTPAASSSTPPTNSTSRSVPVRESLPLEHDQDIDKIVTFADALLRRHEIQRLVNAAGNRKFMIRLALSTLVSRGSPLRV